jgi:S-adenosylmethionine:tRNA ribosyltransferase-isomerase
MLRALGGQDLIMEAYNAALEQGYRWHEFGDSQLILGARSVTPAA